MTITIPQSHRYSMYSAFIKYEEKQHLASLLLLIHFLLTHLLNHYRVSFRHQDGLWENNKAVRYIRENKAGNFTNLFTGALLLVS